MTVAAPAVIAEKQAGVVRSGIYFKDRAKRFADGLHMRTAERKKSKMPPRSLTGLRN